MFFSLISKIALCITKFKNFIGKQKEKVQKIYNKLKKKDEDENKGKDSVEKIKQAKELLGAIRRKIALAFLYLLDIFLSVLDWVLSLFLSTVFLICLIVLIIVALLSVMLPWILDTVAPNFSSGNENSIVESVDANNNSSGGNLRKTAWSEFELKQRGSELTNQEKNVYRLIMLFKQYEKDYDTLDIHFTFGTGVTESGFVFYNTVADSESKSILETPIDGHISGYLKDTSAKPEVYGYGGLFGADLACINYPTALTTIYKDINKTDYKPNTSLIYLTEKDRELLQGANKTEEDLMLDAFAPYSVQKVLCYTQNHWGIEQAYSDIADEVLKDLELQPTAENKNLLMQMACVRNSLFNYEQYIKPVYYFSGMIMKCAENEDGTVTLTNWETDFTYESEMRPLIMGVTGGALKINSVDELSTDKYFKLKGNYINGTMWQYFKKKWGNEEWWNSLESLFLEDLNEAIDSEGGLSWKVQDAMIYHLAISRYLGADNVINSIVSKLTGEPIEGTQGYGVSTELTSNSFANPLIEYRDLTDINSVIKCSTLFGFDNLGGYSGIYCRFHKGIDVYIEGRKDPSTTPVKVASAGVGTVTAVYNMHASMGNCVIVTHPNGWHTYYMHLDSIAVSEGDEVTEETILGIMGTTGLSTGTHLHWQIEKNGTSNVIISPRAVCEQFYQIKYTIYGQSTITNAQDWAESGWDESLFNAAKAEGYEIYWTL